VCLFRADQSDANTQQPKEKEKAKRIKPTIEKVISENVQKRGKPQKR